MNRIAIAVLGAGILALAARPASSFPHITVTACDTISTSPLQVRTTFTLDMVPPTGTWYDMYIQTLPGTQLIGIAGAPAGFYSQVIPDGSPPPTLYFTKPGDYFHDGAHLEGFAIVADRASPCVAIRFSGAVLLEDFNYSLQGCLMKDGPVPAAGTSWGRLKSLYR
jgi:hypothetical protein